MKNLASRSIPAVLAVVLATVPGVALADFEAGLNYFKSGKYVEAAAEFQALVEQSPEYDYGYYILGLSFQKMGKLNDAIKNLRQAIELNPDKFEYHFGLAGAYTANSEYRKAIEALDAAENLAPDQYKSTIAKMRGQSNFSLKKYSQAIDDLEVAVRAKPDAALYDQLGASYYELGHYEKAADAYQKSLKLDPANVKNQQYLAMALLNAAARPENDSKKDRLWGQALTAAQAYAAKNPKDFDAVNLVGRSALGAGRFDEAIKHFNSALQIRPDYCPAMVNKAKAYVALENWKAAEPTLQGAVQCDGSMGMAHELLGFVYRKQERLEDSLAAYQAALKVKPGSAEIQKAIKEVQYNIDVKQHNLEAEEQERKAREEAEAAQREFEEEQKKVKEWEKKREDD